MPEQLSISFEAVDHQQWESVREYIDDELIPEFCRENRKLKKYVAADMGMSPSDLKRKLSPSEGDVSRNFSTDDLETWLEKFNSKPLFYLFEKYVVGGDDEDDIAELERKLAEAKRKKCVRSVA